MKIVLAKPYNLSDHIQPSLGLGYLASACRRNGHEAVIVDCIKDQLPCHKFIEQLKILKPQVVGLQCYTFDVLIIKEILEACKRLNPAIITIIGGPHPSAEPQQCFDYYADTLDYLFVGEAEKGLPLLLDAIEQGQPAEFVKIPGLSFRTNTGIHTNAQVFILELDELGMPAWDLIQPQAYPESQHGAFFEKFPIAPVMLTRGCPYSCSFCVGNLVSGKRLRKHSVPFLLTQIQHLYNDFGIREFHFVDDNFTMDKNFAKSFLKGLIGLHFDISWATPNGVRLDSLDDELLTLMKQSGLYLISLGIESGSDRILRCMKKNTTIDTIRRGVAMIRRYSIDIAGFFIMGFPGETEQDIRKTIDFSLELDLIRANFFTYLPFPGSESYVELITTGELSTVDWDKFYFMNAAYVPKGLTRKRLKYLQRIAFLRFYGRIGIFWKNIRAIKSLRHFQFLVKRFFHWIIM